MVTYDASIEQDALDIVEQLEQNFEVNHLDIIVANAGIAKTHPLVKDVKRAEIVELFETNAYSVVSLYQATRDLLQRSSNKSIFAPMGSAAGALG